MLRRDLDQEKQNTNVRHCNSPEELEARKLTKLTAPCFCFVDGFARLDQRPAVTAHRSQLSDAVAALSPYDRSPPAGSSTSRTHPGASPSSTPSDRTAASTSSARAERTRRTSTTAAPPSNRDSKQPHRAGDRDRSSPSSPPRQASHRKARRCRDARR